MKWSLKLGQVAGIGIYMHWTFLILLAWVAYANIAAGESTLLVFKGIAFILALFFCVVLHELGHALMARRFGVTTRDITLLPIGGLARLERIPEGPWQEFWVALAGPAVNVVIAALLYGVLLVTGGAVMITDLTLVGGPFLASLLWVNVVLVLFNMLPAFPMDGGRVLRSLLALKMSRVRATHAAANVGQVMAIFFGVAGFMGGNWILLFIALFVYLAAHGESQAVEIRSICKSYRVRDAMVHQFHALQTNDTIAVAARESSISHQKDFPVTDGQAIRGVLLHRDLVKALSNGSANYQVGQIARLDCPTIDEDDPLDRALDMMSARGCPILLVERNGRLSGLLSEEHLGQWMMLHSAIQEKSDQWIQEPHRDDEDDHPDPLEQRSAVRTPVDSATSSLFRQASDTENSHLQESRS